jgi:23S rRNA (uracil1939-C5)-methyltransferase
LLQQLAAHVISEVPRESRLFDLYAGTGLFAIAAATVRGVRVTAIEGDPVAARDLDANVNAAATDVETRHQPVEMFMRHVDAAPDTLIVDPPRTGMSREAVAGAIGLGAKRVIYVSCDVATLARDARRLVDAGYLLERVTAFDLFPNTPHVETVAVFDQA